MQIESTTSEIKSTALTTESDPAGGEKKDDENEKAPLGNGGKTETYIWTQTLEDV